MSNATTAVVFLAVSVAVIAAATMVVQVTKFGGELREVRARFRPQARALGLKRHGV